MYLTVKRRLLQLGVETTTGVETALQSCLQFSSDVSAKHKDFKLAFAHHRDF